MKNLKIGMKIFLSFGVVVVMLFFVTGTVLTTNLRTIANINEVDADTNLQTLISGLQTQFMNAHIQFSMLGVKYDEGTYAEFESYAASAREIYKDIYACIDAHATLEPHRESLVRLESEMNDWYNAVDTLSNMNKLREETRNAAIEAQDSLIRYTDTMLTYQSKEMTFDAYVDLSVDRRLSRVERFKTTNTVIAQINEVCRNARLIMQGDTSVDTEKTLGGMLAIMELLEEFVDEDFSFTEQQMILGAEENVRKYHDSVSSFIESDEHLQEVVAGARRSGDDAVRAMDGFFAMFDETVNAQVEDTVSLANVSLLLVAGISVAALIVAIFMAMLINSGISKPVKLLTGVLNQIGATGDLNIEPELMKKVKELASGGDEISQAIASMSQLTDRLIEVGDELGRVANGDLTVDLTLLSEADTMGIALEKMISGLNEMFEEINASTGEVSDGARHIADGANTLAQGTTRQASAIGQLSGSITEVAGKTKENAEQAIKAAQLSGEVKLSAERGSGQMREMMLAVREIGEASGSISKVMKVIDDIAFQTNILALNAAVEAARAGQHGKGFAVVAEEVRSLAAKSAAAARETGTLIANSIEKSQLGARIAQETEGSLNEIVEGIIKTSGIVGEIADSSERQSEAIRHIDQGIEQVMLVVRENSVTAQQSASTSEALSEQSEMLSGLVSRFKLKEQTCLPGN